MNFNSYIKSDSVLDLSLKDQGFDSAQIGENLFFLDDESGIFLCTEVKDLLVLLEFPDDIVVYMMGNLEYLH